MPTILTDNPFTSLSLIAAPAVLTNASSVLALGTSNRFARAIDRARALSTLLEKEEVDADPMTIMRMHQLNRLERRALLLLHALRAFYLALGSFAASALISLIGASVAFLHSSHCLPYHARHRRCDRQRRGRGHCLRVHSAGGRNAAGRDQCRRGSETGAGTVRGLPDRLGKGRGAG